MPIIPKEIHRAIRQRKEAGLPPDRIGEEGVIFFIPDVEKRYVAKQWYASSEKRIHEYPDNDRSPCSPYWHKVKYFEYKLIHKAFPNDTIEVIASYDERLIKNAEGQWEFHFRPGRPTTVSKEVAGDPTLMTQRDAIANPAYNQMLDYHTKTGYGTQATTEERAAFYRVVIRADEQFSELFGEEALRLQSTVGGMLDPRSLETALRQGLILDTGSTLTRMLKHGITAIHPDFNYIPEGREAATGKIQGRYIELTIISPQIYWQQFVVEHESSPDFPKQAKHIARLLDRYQLMKYLDDMFDRCELDISEIHPELLEDDHVQTALFHFFESIRVLGEKQPDTFVDFYKGDFTRIRQTIRTASSPEAILDALKQYTEQIKDFTQD